MQLVLLIVIEDMLCVKRVVHATGNVITVVHVKVKMEQRQRFDPQNDSPRFTVNQGSPDHWRFVDPCGKQTVMIIIN